MHNIRSVENAGRCFVRRMVGINKIYLTGYTATPLDDLVGELGKVCSRRGIHRMEAKPACPLMRSERESF